MYMINISEYITYAYLRITENYRVAYSNTTEMFEYFSSWNKYRSERNIRKKVVSYQSFDNQRKIQNESEGDAVGAPK